MPKEVLVFFICSFFFFFFFRGGWRGGGGLDATELWKIALEKCTSWKIFAVLYLLVSIYVEITYKLDYT